MTGAATTLAVILTAVVVGCVAGALLAIRRDLWAFARTFATIGAGASFQLAAIGIGWHPWWLGFAVLAVYALAVGAYLRHLRRRLTHVEHRHRPQQSEDPGRLGLGRRDP